MQYKDQLVLTGKINDVGSYTRQNISDSYRQGIELEAGMKLNQYFNFSFNTSFSNNKILNYVEYIDNWDTWEQDSVLYNKTDIAFSPSVIVAGSINFRLKSSTNHRPTFLVVYRKQYESDLELSLIPKYVGKQFIDNTSNIDRQLDAYFTCDARICFTRKSEKSGRFISFNFLLRNMLNQLYVNNAWAYTYSLGGQKYSDIGYYPQAGINYFAGLTFGF